jgi:hypothetical protein
MLCDGPLERAVMRESTALPVPFPRGRAVTKIAEHEAGGPGPPEPAGVDGRLEAVLDGRVIGWAWCPGEPAERLAVTIVVDDLPVATCVADGERASLAAAGIGDGVHAFGAELPSTLADGLPHTVRVLAEPSRTALAAALAYASTADEESPFAGTTFLPADRQGDPPVTETLEVTTAPAAPQQATAPQAPDATAPPEDMAPESLSAETETPPQAPARDLARAALHPPRRAIHTTRLALRRWWSSELPHSTAAPRWLLAVGCAAYFVLFLYLTRNFGFFQDEYDYILNRRGWSADTLLAPVNQHLFLIPLLIYKVLFVTVGLHTMWPYQLPVFAMHIASVVGLYVLASRRAGPWIALLPAGLLLVLGAGFELELWAIGMSTLASLAACVWALVFLDRGDRRGDIWASALLTIAIASYSVSLFVVVAIGLVLALTRWRRLWVVCVPLALYALWYAQYGQGDILWKNVPKVPGYDLHIAAYGFAGLAGFSSFVFENAALVVGYPLLAAAVVWVVMQLVNRRPLPILALTGIVAAVGFWTGTALARAQDHQPDVSRYVYPSAVLILVAAIGYLRPRRVSVRDAAVVAVAGVLIAGLGLKPLRAYSIDREGVDARVRVALGAAEVAGGAGDPSFLPDAHHLPYVTLGAYLNAVRDLGSPAFTLPQIQASGYEQLADATLIGAERIYAHPTSKQQPAGAGCSRLLGAAPAGLLEVKVNPGGSASVQAGSAASVRLSVRRFSPSFTVLPQPALAASSSARLEFPQDQSFRAWWLQVGASPRFSGTSVSRLATVCVSPITPSPR